MHDFYAARFSEEMVVDRNVVELAQCIDLDQVYLESADMFSNFASVRIEFEHCITRNNGAERSDCAFQSYSPYLAPLLDQMYSLHVDFK